MEDQQIKALSEKIETLAGKVDSLSEKNAALEKSYAALAKENKHLKSALKQAPKEEAESAAPKIPELPDKTFAVNGKKYKFVSRHFTFNGERVTALDALSDETILAALVQKGSGVIKEVF